MKKILLGLFCVISLSSIGQNMTLNENSGSSSSYSISDIKKITFQNGDVVIQTQSSTDNLMMRPFYVAFNKAYLLYYYNQYYFLTKTSEWTNCWSLYSLHKYVALVSCETSKLLAPPLTKKENNNAPLQSYISHFVASKLIGISMFNCDEEGFG